MAGTILGLDLGPNSIGWAVIDGANGRLMGTGVRVFPEGVDRDQQGGEVPKNQARRLARAMRRQLARRARRRQRVRRILTSAALLPANPDDEFLNQDPYALRRRALDQKLEPHQIGRVILHLNQRRGFLSSRKADRERKKETEGMLAEISELAARIQTAGHRTLGEHLASINDQAPRVRIRGRHTRRDMYQQEFDAIWDAQRPHHPDVLTDELRRRLCKVMFCQRPIRVPKAQIGTCELEPNRRRCPRADRRAQRFRMLCELNNLRYVDADGIEQSVAGELRDKLLAYLSESASRTFDQIRKHLDLPETARFQFEYAGKRTRLWGMPTDAALAHKDIFTKSWYTRDQEERNAIVRALLDREEPEILRLATEEWGLSAEAAARLLDANLPPGYMSYSREAIARLLPHLEASLPLNAADDSPCAITAAGYPPPHRRDGQRLEQLPTPPDLPNPIVRQALFELRRVVNTVVKQFGRPDEIRIELAREVRGSARQREEMTRRLRDRERERQDAADRIREAGYRPNRDTINRYLLWQEQGRECPYTGQSISVAQLFSGETDIDHILPRQRSLDDSLANKVVVFTHANREKGDRTGYEWIAQTDPERFEHICARLRRADYRKMLKFRQRNVELDDFVARQLRDTAYISRAAKQYLECLVEHPHDVLCIKGQLTAELRHQWGLDNVLQSDLLPADAPLGQKNRADHRHHAVDAVVIALTDRSRLQALARQDILPEPWTGFRHDVQNAINAVNVSHRALRKISGALHEDTIYGRTEFPDRFVYRKPVEALTLNEIDSIRDPAVRACVVARLAEFNLSPGRGKGKIPADVWKQPLWMSQEKGICIRRVRLLKSEKTIRPIRDGSGFVKPGSTHHLCIFELANGRRAATFTTMLEAARRARDGEPIIQRHLPDQPDAQFVMSLSRGEMVEATYRGQRRLLCFRTAASTQGQIYFADHSDARPSATFKKFVTTANTLQGHKVTVDPLGRIRNAND